MQERKLDSEAGFLALEASMYCVLFSHLFYHKGTSILVVSSWGVPGRQCLEKGLQAKNITEKLHLKDQFLKGKFEIGRIISQWDGCFVGVKNLLQDP